MTTMTSIANRIGPAGTADKLALMDAYAQRWARERPIQDLAREVTAGCGSRSDACVEAIERWCSRLPYRLEPGDILREPLDTARLGGDCDDLTVLVCALCIALGIPAVAQAVADPAGVIFHVRALVALPPTRPRWHYAIDPVYWSERAWGLAGMDTDLDPRRLMPIK